MSERHSAKSIDIRREILCIGEFKPIRKMHSEVALQSISLFHNIVELSFLMASTSGNVLPFRRSLMKAWHPSSLRCDIRLLVHFLFFVFGFVQICVGARQRIMASSVMILVWKAELKNDLLRDRRAMEAQWWAACCEGNGFQTGAEELQTARSQTLAQ
jgi:hypothetical protein